MTGMAAYIAKYISAHVSEELQKLPDSRAELRVFFHGPPIEYLSAIFEAIDGHRVCAEAANGEVLEVPVLLQVAQMQEGVDNPRIGEPGRCDAAHLMAMRNSSACRQYVVLVPPGITQNLSITSASTEFGLSASANAKNSSFEEWWGDAFVQEVVEHAIATVRPNISRDDAARLLETGLVAAESMKLGQSRIQAWQVLARLFTPTPSTLAGDPDGVLCLASGFPLPAGRLNAKQAISVIDQISDELSSGFRLGIGRLKQDAAEDDQVALDSFLEHVDARCDLLTAFTRSAPAFYCPCLGDVLCDPPEWWLHLTIEKWLELLQGGDAEPREGLTIAVETIVPVVRGGCAVVYSDAKLSISNSTGEPVELTLERFHGGSRTPQRAWHIEIGNAQELVDDSIGEHSTTLRYVASAEGYRSATLKLISLDTWSPGVYVTSRTATKLVVTRKAKSNREKIVLECSLQLAGPGRHYVDLYVSQRTTILKDASGRDASDTVIEARVDSISDAQFGFELDLPGDSYLDLGILADGSARPELLRIHFTCEDVAPANCGSEFERGIALNRREGRQEVYVDRHVRRADLQAWMLDPNACARSFMPIVLAEDYAAIWVPPRMDGEYGHVYSDARFLHDPRPRVEDFSPPAGFVEARCAIAERIRGGDESRLIEEAALGEWVARDAEFAQLVEKYLDEYGAWLANAPEVATWADVILVVSTSRGTKTLDQEPDAILLSPLHPLRFVWHCAAQLALHQAVQGQMPCPAATILDPDCIPDAISLPLRLADGGISWRPFVSVEVDSDYWSVLWNGGKLASLADRARLAPFGADFGINVGGLSSSFSSAQVGRALDDTRGMFAAKSTLGVLITGGSGASQACTQGVIEWAKGQWGEGSSAPDVLGPRLLQVFDSRPIESRPEDATISNLTEDTAGAVKWYRGRPQGSIPDLGIIAQLETSQPSIDDRTDEKAPLSIGGLLRHRIRRQLPGGKFLTETRQAVVPSVRTDSLLGKLAITLSRLENLGATRIAYSFAPNVNAVDQLLNEHHAVLAAVSSSAVDPACFLGRWLRGAYLWDYELPSFSRRAGDTNGYYLLSKLRDAEREGLGKALARLRSGQPADESKLHETLLEVARRGIPTVRGLSSLDSFGTGELGVFVATRLLQDEFREGAQVSSLLPVLAGDMEERRLVLVIPVDPFQSYLEDLARALKSERREVTLSRPDLLVVGVRTTGSQVRVKLTPIEVKCRQSGAMPGPECSLALKQAEALATLLDRIRERGSGEDALLWTLAFQHLVLSMIAFGMRVYSQRIVDGPQGREWSRLHQLIAEAVFSYPSSVEVDGVGRLIVVDKSPSSTQRDFDSDGFAEAIVVGWSDAAEIVHGNPAKLYSEIRGRVGDWRLLPTTQGDIETSGRLPPQNEAPEQPSNPVADESAAQPELAKTTAAIEEAKEQPPIDEKHASHALKDGGGVVIQVGDTVDSFAPRTLSLNLSDTTLNQLNVGVVGDLGTGKTQLLKSMIYQLATSRGNNGVKPRVLIFDYKNDYSSPDFVSAVGAKIARPHKLPINIFDTRGLPDATTPWLDRFSFFADVLDKIYSGIGPVQRTNLKQAVRRAYEVAFARGVQPGLVDVHREYANVVGNRPDSPFAIIDDLVDRQVFSDSVDAGSFSDFFDGVVVISLSALGQDDRAKNMVVAAMLNMFYEHMLRIPKRPFRGSDPQLRTIDSYLLVDEADNIMQYEFDVLKKILLQGREFGVGVILASQYLKHFRVNATDYREPLLTWFIHKVPNVSSQDLAALGLSGSAAELASRVKSLPNHQCLFKSARVEGEIILGMPFYKIAPT